MSINQNTSGKIKERARKIEETNKRFQQELEDFKRKQGNLLKCFREELKQRKINEIRKSLGL